MAKDEKPEIESLRKITLKTIGAQADIEKLMDAPSRRMDLCDVWGVATIAKPGQSDHGAYVKFLGEFKARNLLTGQVYGARALILPRFIEEEIYGALTAPGAQSVDFGFRVSAKFDKDAATKYVYDVKHAMKAKESEALAQIEDQMSKVLPVVKALPAPTAKK